MSTGGLIDLPFIGHDFLDERGVWRMRCRVGIGSSFEIGKTLYASASSTQRSCVMCGISSVLLTVLYIPKVRQFGPSIPTRRDIPSALRNIIQMGNQVSFINAMSPHTHKSGTTFDFAALLPGTLPARHAGC